MIEIPTGCAGAHQVIILVTFVLEASEESRSDETTVDGDVQFSSEILRSNFTTGQQQNLPSDVMAEDQTSMLHPSQEHRPEMTTGTCPLAHSLDEISTLSLREASLVRWFIQKIAPWVRAL